MAVLRDGGGVVGQRAGLAGAVGVVADRGGQLFHAGGRLFKRRGLLFGARRQVGVAGGDLACGHADRIARLAHLAHRRGDTVEQRIEALRGTTHLVQAAHRRTMAQVQRFADMLHAGLHLAQAVADAAIQQPRQHGHHQHGHADHGAKHAHRDRAGALVLGHRVVAHLAVEVQMRVDLLAQRGRCQMQLARRQHRMQARGVVGAREREERGMLGAIARQRGTVFFQQLAVGIVGDVLALVFGGQLVEACDRLGDLFLRVVLGSRIVGERVAVQLHPNRGGAVLDRIEPAHAGQRVFVEVLEALFGLVQLPDAAEADDEHGEQGKEQREKQTLTDIHDGPGDGYHQKSDSVAA